MDREKVIKGFECCHVMVHDLGADKTSCGICPYKDVQTEEQIDLGGIECIAVLHDDALALLKEDCHNCKLECLLQKYDELKEKYDALLKEQEEMLVEYSAFGGMKYGGCPRCNARIDNLVNPKACGFCGQAVKWE